MFEYIHGLYVVLLGIVRWENNLCGGYLYVVTLAMNVE